jgi:DNA-binding response OmpR family regulator
VSLRKRIAVIDDDAYVLRVLEAALRGEGFDVAGFADPRDALAGMRETTPDLILCDVLMPFMDGRALFREVKETPNLRDVPFVFLSGVEGDDEIADTLERGADDFVSKPFSMSRLLAKVRATLRLAERRHDALSGAIGPAGSLPLLKFCGRAKNPSTSCWPWSRGPTGSSSGGSTPKRSGAANPRRPRNARRTRRRRASCPSPRAGFP